jgi:hypothetical protein
MRRTDGKFDRLAESGRRAGGDIPEAIRRSWYHEKLAAELGLSSENPPSRAAKWDDGSPDNIGGLLARPVAIIALTILTFALTFVVLMWRDGRFDGLFPVAPVKADVAKPGWVHDHRAAVPDMNGEAPPATVEEPNEMEAALQAAARAVPPPPPPVASEE